MFLHLLGLTFSSLCVQLRKKLIWINWFFSFQNAIKIKQIFSGLRLWTFSNELGRRRSRFDVHPSQGSTHCDHLLETRIRIGPRFRFRVKAGPISRQNVRVDRALRCAGRGELWECRRSVALPPKSFRFRGIGGKRSDTRTRSLVRRKSGEALNLSSAETFKRREKKCFKPVSCKKMWCKAAVLTI